MASVRLILRRFQRWCMDKAEYKLFHNILSDANHALIQLLPDQRGELIYSLRKRHHDGF